MKKIIVEEIDKESERLTNVIRQKKEKHSYYLIKLKLAIKYSFYIVITLIIVCIIFIKYKTNSNYSSDSSSSNKKNITARYLDFWTNFSLKKFDIHKIILEKYNVKLLNDSNSKITDDPDFIIFSCFGSQHLEYNSVKLYLTLENTLPDYTECDYAIGLRIREGDNRYFKKPIDVNFYSEKKNIYNIINFHGDNIKQKKFCAILVSNSACEVRNEFFERLSKYKKVDSGGNYQNNIGYTVKDKTEFFRNYKFAIVFENAKNYGYASEKIYDAFYAGVIPIYWGDDSLVNHTFNNKSFIHIKDKSEFEEKIKYIIQIDQNDTLYNEIIHEKIILDDKKYDRDMIEFKKFIWNSVEQVFNKTRKREKDKEWKKRKELF